MRLQFADGAHTALEGDQYRDTITVVVDAGIVSPSVGFEQPADSASVGSPFRSRDGGHRSSVVEPSGEINEGAGHFHILVDTDFIPAGTGHPHRRAASPLRQGPNRDLARNLNQASTHCACSSLTEAHHSNWRAASTATPSPSSVDAGIVSPSVGFEQPADGASVGSPFEVVMAATGLVVEPSGEINEGAGTLPYPSSIPTSSLAGQVIPNRRAASPLRQGPNNDLART